MPSSLPLTPAAAVDVRRAPNDGALWGMGPGGFGPCRASIAEGERSSTTGLTLIRRLRMSQESDKMP